MGGEKKIIIAGVVIIVFGVGRAVISQKPIDVPLVAGVSFVLLLSLLSAVSASASNFAGNLALLGMTTVLLIDGPELVVTINQQTAKGAQLTSIPTNLSSVPKGA